MNCRSHSINKLSVVDLATDEGPNLTCLAYVATKAFAVHFEFEILIYGHTASTQQFYYAVYLEKPLAFTGAGGCLSGEARLP